MLAVIVTFHFVAALRSPNMEPCFAYELTAVPMSLFKDATSMRKTEKSQLARELFKQGKYSSTNVMTAGFVINGGWLLHEVKWQPGGVFEDIFHQHVQFIVHHFGRNVRVVFDGYDSGPTTKDHEHLRRSTKAAPTVVFYYSTPAYSNQAAFLANQQNKKAFVDQLMQHLIAAGMNVDQAAGDADCLIVDTALQAARIGAPVTLVANDTDILVMLLYHFDATIMADIVLHMEMTKQAPVRKVSVRALASSLGSDATRRLLVIHAISGCDTTSALFGHGKGTAFKALVKCQLKLTEVVGCPGAKQEDIIAAGLQLMVMLYGGKVGDSLNQLRYHAYMSTVASTSIKLPPLPERLPPTENAAKFHIMRTHLQVVQWRTLADLDRKPEDWG
jgi:hypothetical protein